MSARVSSGCPGFLPQSNGVQLRWIGHAKMTLSVRGISRVNMWGERDRAWIIVGAGSMDQMASSFIVGIL